MESFQELCKKLPHALYLDLPIVSYILLLFTSFLIVFSNIFNMKFQTSCPLTPKYER